MHRDLSTLKQLSDVSKLGKVDLKRICKQLNCPTENLGKKAMISVVCNQLNISTCGDKKTNKTELQEQEPKSKNWLPYLRGWGFGCAATSQFRFAFLN